MKTTRNGNVLLLINAEHYQFGSVVVERIFANTM